MLLILLSLAWSVTADAGESTKCVDVLEEECSSWCKVDSVCCAVENTFSSDWTNWFCCEAAVKQVDGNPFCPKAEAAPLTVMDDTGSQIGCYDHKGRIIREADEDSDCTVFRNPCYVHYFNLRKSDSEEEEEGEDFRRIDDDAEFVSVYANDAADYWTPYCYEDGYVAGQHDATTDEYWCVDLEGDEMIGTRGTYVECEDLIYCVKAVTGMWEHADGKFALFYGSESITNGETRFLRGETVGVYCSSEKKPAATIVPTEEATWAGYVLFSDRRGARYAPMTCTTCEKGTGPEHSIVVEKDREPKHMDQGASVCMGSGACVLVPSTKIHWEVELCCMTLEQCAETGEAVEKEVGGTVKVYCKTAGNERRREEDSGKVIADYGITAGETSKDDVTNSLQDQETLDKIKQNIKDDTGVELSEMSTRSLKSSGTSEPESAGVCTIAEGETQKNGMPCGAKCCRDKGRCMYNFDTKECFEAPDDTCLYEDDGVTACLGPCCDSKPEEDNCEFNGSMRQCMREGAMDPCTIHKDYRLPNGNKCRQECCIRRNRENGGDGCIWHHEDETCTSPRPDDPCVDEAPGQPCLGPCCRGRAGEGCVWNPNSRQCLSA